MSQIAGHLSLPREELSEELGSVFWGELFNSPCPLSSSLVTGRHELGGCWLRFWMLREPIQSPPTLAENALYSLTHLP